MNPLGWVGLGLLGLGLVLVVFELFLILSSVLSLRRRALELQRLVLANRVVLEAELAHLRLLASERELMAKPYRRLLRWLTHPLMVALLQSHRRRRRLA